MNEMLWRILVLLLTALPVLIVDRLIKRYVLKEIGLGNRRQLKNSARLYVMQNKGAFWGVGKSKPKLVLIFSILLITIVIFYCIFLEEEMIYVGLLAAICAGGLSNAIDRVLYGGVIDYWCIRLKKRTMVINFADVAIFISAVVYLIMRAIA